MRVIHSKPWLIAELTLLSVVVPVGMSFFSSRVLFPTLWLSALYCLLMFRYAYPPKTRPSLWQWGALKKREAWLPLLIKFAISAVALTALTLWLLPDKLLSFPLEKPAFWALVMLMYPILSVVPQEFIFRTYFFHRYSVLFQTPRRMVIASAVLFGFSHVLLRNWVAVLLCVVGGYFFADNYRKHRSLGLVVAEHALYGCFVFTIGLGWFFYSGAPHKW